MPFLLSVWNLIRGYAEAVVPVRYHAGNIGLHPSVYGVTATELVLSPPDGESEEFLLLPLPPVPERHVQASVQPVLIEVKLHDAVFLGQALLNPVLELRVIVLLVTSVIHSLWTVGVFQTSARTPASRIVCRVIHTHSSRKGYTSYRVWQPP